MWPLWIWTVPTADPVLFKPFLSTGSISATARSMVHTLSPLTCPSCSRWSPCWALNIVGCEQTVSRLYGFEHFSFPFLLLLEHSQRRAGWRIHLLTVNFKLKPNCTDAQKLYSCNSRVSQDTRSTSHISLQFHQQKTIGEKILLFLVTE